MVRVLMVCTGNTCRSPMAAALFKQAAQERGISVKVDSAGLMAAPGDAATYNAEAALEYYNLDITDHRSKLVDIKELVNYDLILAMTAGHKRQIIQLSNEISDRVFVLKQMAYNLRQESGKQKEKNREDNYVVGEFDLTDPYGQSLDAYRYTASEIVKTINVILDHWQQVTNN